MVNHDQNLGDEVAVKYSGLTGAAGTIEDMAKRLHEDLTDIRTMVSRAAANWEGEAQTAFDGEQKKWDAKAQHIHSLLNDIAKKVRDASAAYQGTDIKAGRIMQGG